MQNGGGADKTRPGAVGFRRGRPQGPGAKASTNTMRKQWLYRRWQFTRSHLHIVQEAEVESDVTQEEPTGTRFLRFYFHYHLCTYIDICNDSLNVLRRAPDHLSRNEEISFGKFWKFFAERIFGKVHPKLSMHLANTHLSGERISGKITKFGFLGEEKILLLLLLSLVNIHKMSIIFNGTYFNTIFKAIENYLL